MSLKPLRVPGSLLLALFASLSAQPPAVAQRSDEPAGANWPTYLGDKARTHYSTLSQINKTNVAQLQVAWTYDAPGGAGRNGEINPLIVNGVVYTKIPDGKTVALDAATGKEVWKFDPTTENIPGGGGTGRGLVYWDGGNGDRRLVLSNGPYLYELNAANGQLIRTFGEEGRVHLGKDLDVDGQPNLSLNTPGTVYKDLLIIGSNPGEGANSPPGHIRAYDLRTGARRWIFHTVPFPGEFGYETFPPEYYKSASAANNWAGMALDEARGIVYVPTGSPGGDFWAAGRWGAGLFGNTLIALDANTGKRLWHFQGVHFDQWDRDFPTPPVLLTVNHNGRRVDAIAQGTKIGYVFVFDRVTGEPLWPIEERPVPQTDLPGMQTWPTQPFPTKPAPLMRTTLTPDDASNISPTAEAVSRLKLQQSPNHGPYPAPSTKQTIFMPGFDGGMEWGGAAADPDGVYYVNVNEVPWIYQMISNQRADGTPTSGGERAYQQQCANCHGLARTGDLAAGFPNLVESVKRLTKEQVAELMQKGGARMPAFTMAEGARAQLIDFLYGDEKAASEYATPGGRGGRGGAGAARGGAPGAAAGGPVPAGRGPAAPAGGANLVEGPAPGELATPAPSAGGRNGAAATAGAPAGAPAGATAARGGRGGGGPAPAYAFNGFQKWTVEGYPGIKPPWGTLNAVDMNTGEIKWRVPLGEYAELTAKGIPITGTETYGGPVVTAGGVVIIASTSDSMIRAFDKDNGKTLWQAKLPATARSTPSTYSVNGKQYVVVYAATAYVAFALPDPK
jgi:quinoprotein glucose dehydrogenase